MLAALLGSDGPESSPTPSDDLQLVWRAPSQCPSTDDVHRMITDALAEHPGDTRPVSASARVDATVTAGDREYRLDLRVKTDGSLVQREIAARDCALLARATGLVVGLALDPEISVEQVADAMQQQAEAASDPVVPLPLPEVGEPTAEPTVDPTVEPPDTTPSFDASASPVPSPRTRSRVAVGLRISGGVDGGILPRIGGGLESSVAAIGRQWRAQVHASRWFSRAGTFPGDEAVGADFAMWSGGARGCLVLVSRVEIPICGGAELAQIHARGFGAPVRLEVRSLWVGAVVAPGIIWLPRPWLGLFGGVTGLVALRRPAFGGQDRPLLHRAAPVAVRALAGIEVRVGAGGSRRKKPPTTSQ